MLFDLATSGDHRRALELYTWFLPLLKLDTLPKFVQLIKLVQAEVGDGECASEAAAIGAGGGGAGVGAHGDPGGAEEAGAYRAGGRLRTSAGRGDEDVGRLRIRSWMPVHMMRIPTSASAIARVRRMKLGLMRRASRAPIWAPIIAPSAIGSARSTPSEREPLIAWVPMAAAAVRARTKWEVAVAM